MAKIENRKVDMNRKADIHPQRSSQRCIRHCFLSFFPHRVSPASSQSKTFLNQEALPGVPD